LVIRVGGQGILSLKYVSVQSLPRTLIGRTFKKAIERLKQAALLDPQSMYEASEERLAVLIRPAGYYNVKVRRLKAFVKTLVERFGGCFDRFFEGEIPEVRTRLLSIPGIGPETADSMILLCWAKANVCCGCVYSPHIP